jgi:hypothetical protein
VGKHSIRFHKQADDYAYDSNLEKERRKVDIGVDYFHHILESQNSEIIPHLLYFSLLDQHMTRFRFCPSGNRYHLALREHWR